MSFRRGRTGCRPVEGGGRALTPEQQAKAATALKLLRFAVAPLILFQVLGREERRPVRAQRQGGSERSGLGLVLHEVLGYSAPSRQSRATRIRAAPAPPRPAAPVA